MDEVIAKKIEDFFERYPKRIYPKNQIMIFSGEAPEKVFCLVAGKVSQYDISYRGDEIVTNIFKPVTFFPMSWAINRTPNAYYFKAEEETVVRVAPPDDVVGFLKDNPDVMLNLLGRVYRGIDGVLERTVHLMSGSAKSRIIHELIIECRRFGEKIGVNSYKLGLHETDLAARVGLARETVSRELKSLKDKRLLTVSTANIIVEDFAELELQLGRTT